MLANYKELGFHICAEVFPEACTFCPFWWYVVTDNTGRCEITGRRIEATGKHETERMSDCPIERGPNGNGV